MKYENWVSLLSSYIASKKNVPFSWGENDCIQFAAGAVKAITGDDYLPRGFSYSSKNEAMQFIFKNGGLVNMINDLLGDYHINAYKAKRGDVVVFDGGNGLMCGIVDDSGAKIASVTENGVIKFPITQAIYIWEIK